MGFQVSPGVQVNEIDLSAVVPSLPTTEAAIAGLFRWGPVGEDRVISSESELVASFGKPTTYNAETWFSAANFLAYSNVLHVVRGGNLTVANGIVSAVANTTAASNLIAFSIKNQTDYDTKSQSFASIDANIKYIAKWPGELGNSLRVSVCDSAEAYQSILDVTANGFANGTASIVNAVAGSNTISFLGVSTDANTANGALQMNSFISSIASSLTVGDLIQIGNSTVGKQTVKVTAIGSVASNGTSGSATFTISTKSKINLRANWSNPSVVRQWEFIGNVDKSPGQSQYLISLGAQGNSAANDELHIVVVDEGGKFTGIPGQILEVYSALSRITTAKTQDGTGNYYADVINSGSKYLWYANDLSGANSATSAIISSSTNITPFRSILNSGQDGDGEDVVDVNAILDGYDVFKDDRLNISLVIAGRAIGGDSGQQVANYIIDNIVTVRKDCMVFVSPNKSDVVGQAAFGNEVENIITFRDALSSTSYAVLDSGYKYQYDRYNDLYRWIPLNGDIAGLTARTDRDRDPWFSPAGLTRGIIKNSIKLAFNPNQTQRDVLYPADINPVVTFPQEGTLLFGDKTLQGYASAFDRINVRRLFIVLEKAIARFARVELFELNDEFTRAQFVNIVEPYLRDVQGRRGITAFKVVCDETNNTPEVIDTNRFVGDIYIAPARSINFIRLNFIATRTGVDFNEIINPNNN